jgi:hypothetical protein
MIPRWQLIFLAPFMAAGWLLCVVAEVLSVARGDWWRALIILAILALDSYGLYGAYSTVFAKK